MLEKEVKILEIDKNEVIKKLISLGATQTFEGFVHDTYYDFVGKIGGKMETNKRIFRVRQKGENHLYTIKRKRIEANEGGEKGVKIADEGEKPITNIESFKNVLEKYGMKKIREKKKYRTSLSLGNLEFDVDEYDSIPTLLEIEAKDKKEIQEAIKLLGLENHKQKTFGSRGLYEYYGKEYQNFE